MSPNTEFYFGLCDKCKERGVGNRTETRKWPDGQISCESCWRYRSGELEKDIPELNIRLNKYDSPKIHEHTITPEDTVMTQEPLDNEVYSLASLIRDNLTNDIRDDIIECLMEDPDLIVKTLANPKYFSLRELKKMAASVSPEEQEKPSNKSYEQVVLKSRPPKRRAKVKSASGEGMSRRTMYRRKAAARKKAEEEAKNGNNEEGLKPTESIDSNP